MPGPKDRDRDYRSTPSRGVPAVVVEDPTPIGSTPRDEERRASLHASVNALAITIDDRMAAHDRKLDEAIKIDKDDHKQLRQDNANLRSDVVGVRNGQREIGARVVSLGTEVSRMTGELGMVHGKVDGMATTLQLLTVQLGHSAEKERVDHQTDAEIEVARVKAKLESELLEKKAHERLRTDGAAFKRKLILRVLAWASPIFVALGGGVVFAFHHC